MMSQLFTGRIPGNESALPVCFFRRLQLIIGVGNRFAWYNFTMIRIGNRFAWYSFTMINDHHRTIL